MTCSDAHILKENVHIHGLRQFLMTDIHVVEIVFSWILLGRSGDTDGFSNGEEYTC